MGLLQNAVETYDAMADRAGIVYGEEREPLAPVSHMIAQAQIEITLDAGGNFVTARAVDKEEAKVVIPATEKSTGSRSGTKAPAHPLCDGLKYLAPYDVEKHRDYVGQLEAWVASEFTHPKIQAILHYIHGETILQDLSCCNLIQLSEDGIPKNDKLLVRWVVIGLGEHSSGPCWTDQELIESFIDYYATTRKQNMEKLCMVSGSFETPVDKHPKGIIPGAVALISSDDKDGYTFRGRFDAAWQAATVGYTASQKAHNALRWLVANQAEFIGGRAFLCWNPQGCPVPRITGPMGRKSKTTFRSATPTEYQEQLRKTLLGWRAKLPNRAGVVITAFDAPSNPGRLSITYYNELLASDFLDRLCDWEKSCCWENGAFGIQSPSLFQIVNLAFGTLRSGKVDTDSRILSQQMQRLIACRIDRAAFPVDIERNLVERASNIQIYTGQKPEETRKLREGLLFTACAVIRKYHIDHCKEEWDMALDKDCTDRSYLFGRLLAIAEMVERSTYSGENTRETNALRMQKAFALRPMASWRMLEERLEPYYKQLSPGLRQYYRRMVQEITDRLSPASPELNQKLEDIYLLGYYHQRAYHKEKPETEE